MTATAIDVNNINEPEARTRPHQVGTRRLLQASGLLYVVLFALGMFSPLVLESLIVQGDGAATVDKISGSLGLFGSSLVTWSVIVIADIAISVTLYLLLEPVSRTLSLVTAAVRIGYSAVLGAFVLNLFEAFSLLNGAERLAGLDAGQVQTNALLAIDRFESGFLVALVLFGFHLVMLGVLLGKSGYVPHVLSVLLAVAGAGYIVNSFASFYVADYSDVVSTALLVPALFGELGLTAWLLIKGFGTRRNQLN